MQQWVNEAGWDRAVRVVGGLVLIALWLSGTVAGVAGIVVGSLGLILLATGLVGVCPLYLPFRFRTNKK